jgi:hypothetical protein
VQEGGPESGTKLVEHREALDTLIPVLEEWDIQLGTFVLDISVAISEEQKAFLRIEEVLGRLTKRQEKNDAKPPSAEQSQYGERLKEAMMRTSTQKEMQQ